MVQVKRHYIGLESVVLAQERVRKRVLKGGHGVSEEIIEKRYYQSMENLVNAIKICDEVHIYDNTKDMISEVADLVQKKIIWKCDKLPCWCEYCLKDI